VAKIGEMTEALNKKREWVPAVPEPYYCLIRKRCMKCGKMFFTVDGYRGHYALAHILYM